MLQRLAVHKTIFQLLVLKTLTLVLTQTKTHCRELFWVLVDLTVELQVGLTIKLPIKAFMSCLLRKLVKASYQSFHIV